MGLNNFLIKKNYFLTDDPFSDAFCVVSAFAVEFVVVTFCVDSVFEFSELQELTKTVKIMDIRPDKTNIFIN